MSKNKFLTGLLVGVAAGAVAGLLFAPDSGMETRKKIGKKANDLRDNVMDRIDALTEKVINTGTKAGETVMHSFNETEKFEHNDAPKMKQGEGMNFS